MRDRNDVFRYKKVRRSLVCILPMRDRNRKWIWKLEWFYPCLYLTYEGSKLFWIVYFRMSLIYVCILPMRDRNGACFFFRPNAIAKFVSYLWGIETIAVWVLRRSVTRLYLTYEGSKPGIGLLTAGIISFVCILPMRDRNKDSEFGAESFVCVCILPMRDRNKISRTIYKLFPVKFVSYLWGIET